MTRLSFANFFDMFQQNQAYYTHHWTSTTSAVELRALSSCTSLNCKCTILLQNLHIKMKRVLLGENYRPSKVINSRQTAEINEQKIFLKKDNVSVLKQFLIWNEDCWRHFFLFSQRQRTGKSLPLSVGYTEGFVNKDGKNSQVLQKISFEWPLGKSLRTKVHPPLNCRLLSLVTNYFTDCFSKLFHNNGR